MNFRVHVDKERCKGCGYCVAVCPKGTFQPSERRNARGHLSVETTSEGRCVACEQCTLICPEAAIEIEDARQTAGRAKVPLSADEPAASNRTPADWPAPQASPARVRSRPHALVKGRP